MGEAQVFEMTVCKCAGWCSEKRKIEELEFMNLLIICGLVIFVAMAKADDYSLILPEFPAI